MKQNRATDLPLELAPSYHLISNQFDMREQNSGAKVLLRNIFFRYKSLVQTRELCSGSVLRERAAGACCGSKFPRVYRP